MKSTFPIVRTAALLLSTVASLGVVHADSWVTVNPDGTTTRTEIERRGGANIFHPSTRSNPISPDLANTANNNARRHNGDVIEAEQDDENDHRARRNRNRDRNNGNNPNRRRRNWGNRYPQQNPVYVYPGYGYPNYPYPVAPGYGNPYVVPNAGYNGPIGGPPFSNSPPWINTIPQGTYIPPSTYPGYYPYPTYPQGTIIVPSNGYYVPSAPYYGSTSGSYGTFSYNRGGIGITIGGGRTTTSSSTTIITGR